MVRFSGRAPTPVETLFGQELLGGQRQLKVNLRSPAASLSMGHLDITICRMCSMLKLWKMMVSSTRFKELRPEALA